MEGDDHHDDPQPDDPHRRVGARSTFGHAFDEVVEAAIEAEYATGRHEETEAQARRGVIIRLARAIGGFALMGVGLALLPLPGPGWLIIIVGLSLLPYAWAERTIRAIRRRVPGIPEDGRIPATTWVVMGVMVTGALVISLVWGATISQWISGLWGDPDRLLL
jgi:hypothetical protein